jgi:plasmid stabilization system protein ParE
VTRRYLVEISAAAQRDVILAHDYIAGDNPQAAARWVTANEAQMLRLHISPLGHEVMPEAADLDVIIATSYLATTASSTASKVSLDSSCELSTARDCCCNRCSSE